MPNELSREDQALFLVYESAQKELHHANDIKVRLTGIYITITGIAAAGLALIVEGKVGKKTDGALYYAPENVIAAFGIIVGILGVIVVLIFSRLTDLQNNNIVMMKEVMGRFFGSKDEINRRYEPIPGKIDNHWAIFVSLLSAGIFSFGLNIAILGLFRSPNKNDIYIDLYYPTAVTVVLGVFFLYFVLSIYAKTVSLGGARELIQSVIKSRNR